MPVRTYWIYILLLSTTLVRAEPWADALARMPLRPAVGQLNRTNCAEVMLGSFQADPTVKALLFLPGSTDELFFFRRAQATLTNAAPTLLDAVAALTNQTHIRAVFRAPFLLLHSGEDLLDLQIEAKHPATIEKLKQTGPLPPWHFNDHDWDALRKTIKGHIGPILWPGPGATESRHFYRHTFAAFNLNGWETLEAAAYTSRARLIVRRFSVVFEPDDRVGELPRLEKFPK